MKKYLIGLLSVLLLVGSILGASAKRPRPARSGRTGDPAMWI
jgi:hypothetical protein